MSWLSRLLSLFRPQETIERPSPKIRIRPEQVKIENDTLIVPGLTGCFIAAVAPKNSMEPVIDDGMFVFLDPTVSVTDLIVGDIIMYEHPDFNGGSPVLHRIIGMGQDTDWYCQTKGDNNAYQDPVKVRASHIKGVYRGQIC